mmetsp:Transcript_5631/g.15825  ORF Transcript_5631/g.15825 Transcript_5631/m.15825 type:complete len:357 (-) Transcript_5631:56-1126(-)
MEAGADKSGDARQEAMLERKSLLEHEGSTTASATGYGTSASLAHGRDDSGVAAGVSSEARDGRDQPVASRSSRDQVERRRSSGGLPEDRRQFQAARQEVFRNAVWNTRGGMYFLLVLLGFILILIPACLVVFIEVWSWVVLIAYSGLPCDQGLAFWLLMRNLISLFTPRLPDPDEAPDEQTERRRKAARLAALTSCGWLFVGLIWSGKCKTCQHTNPKLYEWVRFMVVCGLLVNCIVFFIPLLLRLVATAYHVMVSRGWIKSPNAANEKAIEHMLEVPFDPDVFSPDFVPQDGRTLPPAECCCCMEDFSGCKKIVCTPCDHYFHKDCLKEWLALSKTCPLCRSDLDISEPVQAREV